MTWGFVAAGAGAVIGGALSSDASRRAANTQSDAAGAANQLQWDIYQQQRTDQQPWMQAGQSALAKLTGLLNSGQLTSKFAPKNLQNEPGYQFGLKEGQKNLENSAAARGMSQSGEALKAAQRYGQDYAGTKYNDAFNRFYAERENITNPLFRLAGLGAGANQQVGGAGQVYGNQAGGNMIGAANAQAASGISRGNTYGNVLGQIGALGSRYPWGAISGGSTTPYDLFPSGYEV